MPSKDKSNHTMGVTTTTTTGATTTTTTATTTTPSRLARKCGHIIKGDSDRLKEKLKAGVTKADLRKLRGDPTEKICSGGETATLDIIEDVVPCEDTVHASLLGGESPGTDDESTLLTVEIVEPPEIQSTDVPNTSMDVEDSPTESSEDEEAPIPLLDEDETRTVSPSIEENAVECEIGGASPDLTTVNEKENDTIALSTTTTGSRDDAEMESGTTKWNPAKDETDAGVAPCRPEAEEGPDIENQVTSSLWHATAHDEDAVAGGQTKSDTSTLVKNGTSSASIGSSNLGEDETSGSRRQIPERFGSF